MCRTLCLINLRHSFRPRTCYRQREAIPSLRGEGQPKGDRHVLRQGRHCSQSRAVQKQPRAPRSERGREKLALSRIMKNGRRNKNGRTERADVMRVKRSACDAAKTAVADAAGVE